MDDGLKWFRLLDDYSEIKSYCVVAGGDGTVGKCIEGMHQFWEDVLREYGSSGEDVSVNAVIIPWARVLLPNSEE